MKDTVVGHWNTQEGSAMARKYVLMPRQELMGQNISDMELANLMYLEPSLINLTMAKERLRWLSVQLAKARGLT